MPTVRDRPVPTQIFDFLERFVPDAGSAYIFGSSVEDRSAHSKEWEQLASGVLFVRLSEPEEGGEGSFVTCNAEFGGHVRFLRLRSSPSLKDFWASVERRVIYLDITGLSHHVWAPLVKSALAFGLVLRVVYVEPRDYRFSSFPTEGEIFDLSEKIRGIAPLPGFAVLSSRPRDFIFVPLLGFEGARLAYALEQVQPVGDKVIPVVGVPGFKAEYPFHTYLGNRLPFTSTRSWRNVFFARANCPFSLFYALADIASRHVGVHIKVAPIGTKPHSLGAVLYSLMSQQQVIELVYDHPIRKVRRTEGASRASVYHVSSFAQLVQDATHVPG